MRNFEGSISDLVEVLFWHLPIGTQEHHEILTQNYRRPGRDSNRIPPEYKSRMLPLRQLPPISLDISCQLHIPASLPLRNSNILMQAKQAYP
jgi:hypothetical protein